MTKVKRMRLYLCALLCAACPVWGFDLIRNGQPEAEIVSQNPNQEHHARFFSSSLEKCTGAALQIVSQSSGKKNVIRFKEEPRTPETEDKYEISFPDSRTMLITGSNYSIRWALNHLLEAQGVCFVMTGPHGTYYPKLKTVAVPEKKITADADIKIFRNLFRDEPAHAEAMCGKHALDEEPVNFFHHNLYSIFPLSKYGNSPWKEKLMPELKGKRSRPAHEGCYWQPCFSNPESVTEAVKNLRAYLDKNPSCHLVSLGMNDNGNFCHCKNCKEMNGGFRQSVFRPHLENFSPIYYKWCGQVIEEVLKTHPDTYFGCLAYREVTDPPPFKIHPRLTPVICCEVFQFHYPEGAAKTRKILDAWAKVTEHFGIYDYAFGARCGYCPPRVYPHLQDVVMKEYVRRGCRSFFAEGDNLGGEGPKRYLFYKLCFNAGINADAELQKWYEACVGKEAAPWLKEYYDFWEKYWTRDSLRKTNWFESLRGTYMSYYNPTFIYAVTRDDLKKTRAMMEKVVELANRYGDPDQKIRAEKLMDYFRYYEGFCYLSGAGAFPLDGNFGSVENCLKFIRNIPEMEKYYQQTKNSIEKIEADRRRENYKNALHPFGDDIFVKWENRLPLAGQLDAVLQYAIQYPEVMTELEKTEKVCREPFFKDKLQGFLRIKNAPNRIETNLSDEQELALWRNSAWANVELERTATGKRRYKLTPKNPSRAWVNAARIIPARPNRQYFLSATVTFKTAKPHHRGWVVLAHASRTDYSYYYGLHQKKKQPILVNTPVKLYDLTTFSSHSYLGRAQIVLIGINEGDCVYVEDLEVKELSAPDELKPLDGFTGFADFQKNWTGLEGFPQKDGKAVVGESTLILTRKAFPIQSYKDKLRVTVSAKGKGFFSFLILLQSARTGAVLKRIWPVEEIQLLPGRQTFEFEPDFPKNKFTEPVEIKIGLRTKPQSEAVFDSIMVEHKPYLPEKSAK